MTALHDITARLDTICARIEAVLTDELADRKYALEDAHAGLRALAASISKDAEPADSVAGLVGQLRSMVNGPHSDERTASAADLSAQAVRYLNHATRAHSALEHPATAAQVCGSLAAAAHGVPQLCVQLAAWLESAHAVGRLADDYGGPVATRIDRVGCDLETAARYAREVGRSLDAAQSALSTIHVVSGGEPG